MQVGDIISQSLGLFAFFTKGKLLCLCVFMHVCLRGFFLQFISLILITNMHVCVNTVLLFLLVTLCFILIAEQCSIIVIILFL